MAAEQFEHCCTPLTLDAEGCQIVPRLFDAAEIDGILAELSLGLPHRSKAGARHLMAHPAVACAANDQRMLTVARRFVGPDPQPFRATLFDKSPDLNWLVVWHQDTALPLTARCDTAGWGPWSMKAGVHYAHAPAWALERIVALRLHLDDSTEQNGPLRIIPGSHRHGVLSDEAVHAMAQASTHLDCLVPRGGVLAMRPLMIHASSKSRTDRPRRVLHIEYADSLSLGPELQLAIC